MIRYLNEQYAVEVSEPFVEYRSKYVAEASFMHGDADFYSSETWTFDTNEELIAFFEALPDFRRLSREREWSGSDLSPQSYKFFNILTEDQYNAEKLKDAKDQEYDVKYSSDFANYLDRVELDWPRDKSCDDCGDAGFDSYQLFWYDEDGKKSVVKLTLKKGE